MNSKTEQIKSMLGTVKKIVVMKFGADCWICGKEGHDLSHMFGVAWRGTAFDTKEDGNCHILCRDCHSKDHSAELHPSYEETYKERFGEDKYYSISRRAHARVSFPSLELDMKEEELDEELAKLIKEWKGLQ